MVIRLLIHVSFVGWVVSLFWLNAETASVAALVFACWAAILARIEYANRNHREQMAALSALRDHSVNLRDEPARRKAVTVI